MSGQTQAGGPQLTWRSPVDSKPQDADPGGGLSIGVSALELEQAIGETGGGWLEHGLVGGLILQGCVQPQSGAAGAFSGSSSRADGSGGVGAAAAMDERGWLMRDVVHRGGVGAVIFGTGRRGMAAVRQAHGNGGRVQQALGSRRICASGEGRDRARLRAFVHASRAAAVR